MSDPVSKLRHLTNTYGNKGVTALHKTDDGTGGAGEYPVQLFKPDPRDEAYEIRKALVDEQSGIVPGVGQAVVTDEDFKYFQSKQNEFNNAEFKDWLIKNADYSTPEKSEYWNSKFPWITELRLEEIQKKADLQMKLARIQITGPQNEDDYILIYGIQQGYISVPDGPLHKDKSANNNFKEGLFSIFSKTLGIKPTIENMKTINWTNPMGTNGSPTGNMGVPRQSRTAGWAWSD